MRVATETTIWRQALASLVVVPAGHAKPNIQPADAVAFLGCSQRTWQVLVADGLPLYREGLDRFDLINLALRAKQGKSIPETALRHALSFVVAPRDSWCARKQWRVTMRLNCHHADDVPQAARRAIAGDHSMHASEETWRIWPPLSWPETERRQQSGVCILEGSSVTKVYDVTVAGRAMRLTSPLVRAIVEDYIGDDRQFCRMPMELQHKREWMRKHGVFDCLSASLDLKELCDAAGVEARVRQGWLAGLIASQHAWLEVLDCDKRWKTVDIAFRALAKMLYPDSAEFSEFCLGSRMNRVFATCAPATERLVEHRCNCQSPHFEMGITTTSVRGARQ